MQLKEFYEILETGKWSIGKKGEIRTTCKIALMCPITYVNYKITGEIIDLEYPGSARKTLKIPKKAFWNIISAADNPEPSGKRAKEHRKRLETLIKDGIDV